jgi:hypothetical protein
MFNDDSNGITPKQFEQISAVVMGKYFDTTFRPAKPTSFIKTFDLISADNTIIGDAELTSLNGDRRLPPAKFSAITERVWLLEKTLASRRFLAFGNDIHVPKRWLCDYGSMLVAVEFYFIDIYETVTHLNPKPPR